MAATSLTYAETAVAQRTTYPDLLNKLFDVVLLRANKVPLQGMQFCNKQTTNKMTFQITSVGSILDLPVKSEDTDDIPMAIPAPGRDTTITMINYRRGVAVERTLVETDQHGKIRGMLSGLPKSAQRKIEYLIANVFNTGTTTAGADGSFLFGNDHIHDDPAGGTWSNLGTAAALTTAAYDTAYVAMGSRTDEKGGVSPVTAGRIIVPLTLRMKALQIAKSEFVPEYSTRGINPYQGVEVFVYNYLTSTTGWMLWGDLDQSEWGIEYVERVAPTVEDMTGKDISTDVLWGKRIRFSVAVGATILKNIHYNVGA